MTQLSVGTSRYFPCGTLNDRSYGVATGAPGAPATYHTGPDWFADARAPVASAFGFWASGPVKTQFHQSPVCWPTVLPATVEPPGTTDSPALAWAVANKQTASTTPNRIVRTIPCSR